MFLDCHNLSSSSTICWNVRLQSIWVCLWETTQAISHSGPFPVSNTYCFTFQHTHIFTLTHIYLHFHIYIYIYILYSPCIHFSSYIYFHSHMHKHILSSQISLLTIYLLIYINCHFHIFKYTGSSHACILSHLYW